MEDHSAVGSGVLLENEHYLSIRTGNDVLGTGFIIAMEVGADVILG